VSQTTLAKGLLLERLSSCKGLVADAAARFNLADAQQAATRQASIDVRQVNGTNIISVNPESLVFNQEIFTQLIVRFSHLPRGNQYILGAAQYMRPIMRRICCLIDKREQITIEESITNINPFYPYKPKGVTRKCFSYHDQHVTPVVNPSTGR
jgi:hypothetical protein